MQYTCKTTFLSLALCFLFSSCELIELTQEEAVKVNASGSYNSLSFSARNISGRHLDNVRWTATIYDEEDDYLESYSGRFGTLMTGKSFSEFMSFCSCDDAHCARIAVKWDNKKGRTCYEWCTIYL